jgi:hypothetical protein
MRGLMCQHCANQSLQLQLPPNERHSDRDGWVVCLICRTTRAKAALLHPETVSHPAPSRGLRPLLPRAPPVPRRAFLAGACTAMQGKVWPAAPRGIVVPALPS